MTLVKQKFREIILQILYSHNFIDNYDNDLVFFMMDQIKTTKKNILISLDFVKKILEHVNEFDSNIKKAAISYDFDRISKVELSVLRLAMYEIEYEKLPFQIVISEAIRLIKKFSSINSISFINAILDCVYQKEHETVAK